MLLYNKNRRGLAFLLSLSLFLGVPFGNPLRTAVYAETEEKSAISDSMQKIEENKQKMDDIAAEQDKVRKTLDSLNKLKDDAKAYITELDKNLTALSDEITEIAENISGKESEIAATQTALEQAKAVESEQYASMKLRIRYMYEKGDTSFIDMILNAKNWSYLLNKAEYISKI